MALYEEWNQITVTMPAEKMKVSKMSITRVFDEIEGLEIPILKKKGRTRCYEKIGTKREIWPVIEPFLVLFKAKAWLDLNQKLEAGEHVDSRDIKKHRNDVLRIK